MNDLRDLTQASKRTQEYFRQVTGEARLDRDGQIVDEDQKKIRAALLRLLAVGQRIREVASQRQSGAR